MRIAVNTRFLLSGKLEGLGWYTGEIVRRMVMSHPEDEFYFLFDRPFDPTFIYADNVKPLVLFPPARHPLLWYAWFEWAVPAALKRCRADAFFSPDSYLSLRSDTPTVMTVHDIIPLQQPQQVPWGPRMYYQHFLPRYIRRADRIITVSDYTKDSVVATCGTPPEKIASVYNGCRAGFQPLPDAEQQKVRMQYADGAPYFFYAGSIHPRKNAHRLIRAFDRFKNDTGAPLKLLLAGRFAWQTGEVRTAWETARFKEDIRFLGYVSESDLRRLTASALALSFVSLSEGFGLPLAEAMYCDTPIITSNTSALKEVAADAALTVNPESEEEIFRALKLLYTDSGLRDRLVAAGRRRRNAFDWDHAAAETYRNIKETSARN